MNFSKIIIACSLICLTNAYGSDAQIDSEKINSLVNNYYIREASLANSHANNLVFKLESKMTEHHIGDCSPGNHHPPDSSNCINEACNFLGSYGCDSASEVQAVATACRGVDSSCLNKSCALLGNYGCDSISEIQGVTGACRKVADSRCIDVVCNRLGNYGCDSLSEIIEVGNACSNRVDIKCIETVCDKLGSYGCDSLSEVANVAKSCSGQN